MKILVELPKPYYDRLRDACDPTSKEFIMLTNGCVETKKIGGHLAAVVQIVCEKEQAQNLCELASRVRPFGINADLQMVPFFGPPYRHQ